jgi:hypothetical protein
MKNRNIMLIMIRSTTIEDDLVLQLSNDKTETISFGTKPRQLDLRVIHFLGIIDTIHTMTLCFFCLVGQYWHLIADGSEYLRVVASIVDH